MRKRAAVPAAKTKKLGVMRLSELETLSEKSASGAPPGPGRPSPNPLLAVETRGRRAERIADPPLAPPFVAGPSFAPARPDPSTPSPVVRVPPTPRPTVKTPRATSSFPLPREPPDTARERETDDARRARVPRRHRPDRPPRRPRPRRPSSAQVRAHGRASPRSRRAPETPTPRAAVDFPAKKRTRARREPHVPPPLRPGALTRLDVRPPSTQYPSPCVTRSICPLRKRWTWGCVPAPPPPPPRVPSLPPISTKAIPLSFASRRSRTRRTKKRPIPLDALTRPPASSTPRLSPRSTDPRNGPIGASRAR